MTRREWLVAVILTFITVCAWVVFDIIHTRSQVEISPVWEEAKQPIDPQFDLKALEDAP